MINYLNSNNDDIKLNAIMSLEGLAEDYSDIINIKQIIMLLESDTNQQIKKVDRLMKVSLNGRWIFMENEKEIITFVTNFEYWDRVFDARQKTP